jgi:hypothetical protein
MAAKNETDRLTPVDSRLSWRPRGSVSKEFDSDLGKPLASDPNRSDDHFDPRLCQHDRRFLLPWKRKTGP